MRAFVYGFTENGVMVQVHHKAPTDKEWAAMLLAIEARGKTLKSVIAIARSEAGPTSKQRGDLARTIKLLHVDLRFALLTDSRVARGVLTAINWLTGRDSTSAAFPTRDVDAAFVFLKLTPEEKKATRGLLQKLDGGSAEQFAALP